MSYHTLTHKQVIKYHKDFVLSNPDIYRKERPHHIDNTKSTQNPAMSQAELTLGVVSDKGKFFVCAIHIVYSGKGTKQHIISVEMIKIRYRGQQYAIKITTEY